MAGDAFTGAAAPILSLSLPFPLSLSLSLSLLLCSAPSRPHPNRSLPRDRRSPPAPEPTSVLSLSLYISLSFPPDRTASLSPSISLSLPDYTQSLQVAGAVELASAGVSVSIFNIISKLFNVPLLSITTSFVAEDISKHVSRESNSDRILQKENDREIPERIQLHSISTALLLASGIGIIEALALYFGAGLFLNMMGIPSGGPFPKIYFLNKLHRCTIHHKDFFH